MCGYLHQQNIDTSTPSGKAMFQMAGVFAEFERSMIQERVRAGLDRAREQGKSWVDRRYRLVLSPSSARNGSREWVF
jgi:DNA invertase Pin-like site-specific DNA recombinase